ncbi:hypothetical protein AAG570_009425 [Ranatra chinensis]|uniref:Cilia- and flagella-associated protein 58 central coiled coil domain-containing protein n=1 Tax=Ranatra chinensis TaxID=642074 RepID=A0ABD0ZCC0_9HEMI
MASKRRNMLYQNEKQETMEIAINNSLASSQEKKDDLTRLLKIKAIAEKETEEARYQVNQLKRDIKLNETALENKARVIAKHESVIADMKNFIERVENENEELVQALKHEQEEVYLTNCRILEILDTNDEYARQFKIQENELVKLRKDLTQNANIQEVATRKVAASERAKDKVLMELEKARYATHVKAKELSTKEKEMHLSKRTTESLLREKEILNKNILRMAEMVRENLLKYQLESRLKKNLEVERDVFKKELGKIRLVMITLQKEKERSVLYPI